MRQSNFPADGDSPSIDLNAFSSIVYERTFQRSHTLAEDVNTVTHAPIGMMTMLPVDALLRLEYVAQQSATSARMPDFDAWLRTVPREALSMDQPADGWIGTLIDEVVQTFFPKQVAVTEVAAEGGGDDSQASE